MTAASQVPFCPAVALTYDLCPVRTASGFDRELIDFLIAHKVPATFFMSGRWMAKHDAEVKELLAVPFFEIGTHGDVHAHLPMHEMKEQQQEIMGPVRALKNTYGRPATTMPGPERSPSPEVSGGRGWGGVSLVLCPPQNRVEIASPSGSIKHTTTTTTHP